MSKYFHLIIASLFLLSFGACQTGGEIDKLQENRSTTIQQSSLTIQSELEILFVNVRLVQEPYHAEVINTVFEDDFSNAVSIDCQQSQIAADTINNNMSVSPAGVHEENYINATDELEYQIHFQNLTNEVNYLF